MKDIYAETSEAFAIFAKYDHDHGICAEHDEIYAGPSPEQVSAEDIKRLSDLGWEKSEDCFVKFV